MIFYFQAFPHPPRPNVINVFHFQAFSLVLLTASVTVFLWLDHYLAGGRCRWNKWNSWILMKNEDIDEHKMKNIKLFSVGPDLASALPVFLLSLSLSSFLLSGSTSLPKSLYVCISPPPSPPSQSYHQNPHPFSYPLTSSTSSIYISHNILIHIYLLTLSLPMSALACCCLLRPQAPRPLLYVVSSNISLSH